MPHKEVKKTIDELTVELKKTPKETGILEEILEQAREGIERYTPEAVQDLLETLRRESDNSSEFYGRVSNSENTTA